MGGSLVDFLIRHSPLLYLTQSLWRDEAFSILVSERPLSFFIGKLTFEPPLYYILLHFWMKIFGNSEVAARSLSLLGFCLATVIMIFWAERLFRKHWLSWFLPVFFFLNPMLLYYAFEIRTYGWFTFFATLALFTYSEKKWLLYTAAIIGGFYTHSYFILLPFATGIHYLTQNPKQFFPVPHLRTILRSAFIRANLVFFLGISPWLYLILEQASRLKDSWYYPVDLQLIKSVLGNMFIGYEGTPWFLWRYTAWLSLLFLGLFILALRPEKTRSRNLLFFLVVMVPLVVSIGVSFVKPLFVNRYVLPVTIAEILLLTLAIETIRHRMLQKLVAAGLLLLAVGINIWYPQQHQKLDIRKTIGEINAIRGGSDKIYVETPLLLFESIYYSTDRSAVFLYNPQNAPFPWYVGDAIFSPSQMVKDLPNYPNRAFMIHPDGTFSVNYRQSLTVQTQPASPAQPR